MQISEAPVEPDNERRQGSHPDLGDLASGRIPGVGQYVLTAEDVRYRAECRKKDVTASDVNVPVFSDAEVDTKVRWKHRRAGRPRLVMRASAELTPLIDEVARLPFETARDHRGTAPNAGRRA